MIVSAAPRPWHVAMDGPRIVIRDRSRRIVEEAQEALDRAFAAGGPWKAREEALAIVAAENKDAPDVLPEPAAAPEFGRRG